jgi:hypothetical protein
MSGTDETAKPEEQQEPPGGFGELIINDDLVQVHRHPDNAHLDQPKDEDPAKA